MMQSIQIMAKHGDWGWMHNVVHLALHKLSGWSLQLEAGKWEEGDAEKGKSIHI